MTVTYSAEVATSSFSCFLKLLLRWRGSVYKLLWKDFLLFAGSFYTLSFVYRFALKDNQKRIFEKVAKYCETYNSLIPVAFVLGFYVSIVVSRWWDQFNHIPWPDRMAMFVTANLHGHDERGRVMRRTLMRYLCLSFVITMSSICPPVKKRFPTFGHMTQAGFMLENEEEIIKKVPTQHNKYFVPLAWATSLVARARSEGRIKDDFAVKTLIDEINDFRGKLGSLFNFDWVNVPLVYTQVVTLAVYTFFLSCLMGRQFLERGHVADMYFPIFTFLQFFFYMGWLKVAETLVNPFGEDDDDFDVNMLVDRNLQVSYLYVDEMHDAGHPELIKDQYWDTVDFGLPHTKVSESHKAPDVFLGSAMNINIPKNARQFTNLESVAEHDEMMPGRAVSGDEYYRQRSYIGIPSPTTSRFSHFLSSLRGKGSKKSLNSDQTQPMRTRQRNENSVGSAVSSNLTLNYDDGEQEVFQMDDISYMGEAGCDEVGDRRGAGNSGRPGPKKTPQPGKHSMNYNRSNSRDGANITSTTTLNDSQATLRTISERDASSRDDSPPPATARPIDPPDQAPGSVPHTAEDNTQGDDATRDPLL